MRIFIAGVDGYLGWALAQYLAKRGHHVGGVDALLRREWVAEVGGQSAVPIASIADRLSAFREHYDADLALTRANLLDYAAFSKALAAFQPDAIVHLAEMPSAAYSMIDPAHAAFTQQNNVIGNLHLLWAVRAICPQAHIVKLGTMGEYGTPNVPIPEGFFELEYRGRKDILPFPRQAGSYYHLSKVFDSQNTAFACKVWGLRATDIMQGVVFGTRTGPERETDPRMWTRLDFDQCFGTVINRFCCQAIIEHPLTVYGAGGQTRGFLPLRDSLQCLTLTLENPPEAGQYRVFNQFESCFVVGELAALVQAAAGELGIAAVVEHYENPRYEADPHYYQPDREHLLRLGYVPTHDIKGEIRSILLDLLPHRDRIRSHAAVLLPDIRWDGTRQLSTMLYNHETPR